MSSYIYNTWKAYWNKVTNKNRPESGDVSFDADGNVVNIDRDSGQTYHKDAIIKYSDEAIKNIKDQANQAIKELKEVVLLQSSNK